MPAHARQHRRRKLGRAFSRRRALPFSFLFSFLFFSFFLFSFALSSPTVADRHQKVQRHPIGRASLGRLDGCAGPLSLATNETDQISQGHRREYADGTVIDPMIGVRMRHGQVGPPPWPGPHHAVVESSQHPGRVAAPEDTADTTSLPAARTLFRDDRERRTA